MVYLYDGWKICETRDGSSNMVQQFIHGTQYIDELVMARVANKGDLYIHQDANWNVIAVTDLGGHLVERSIYTPYGELTVHQDTSFGDRDGDGDVDIWGYRLFDFERDGDVSGNTSPPYSEDFEELYNAYTLGNGTPTNNPSGDDEAGVMDGDCDLLDFAQWNNRFTDADIEPVALHTSAVGNPFFFTGRRMHWLEDLTQAGINDNVPVQYNRARHYDPMNGRWLQRDPLGVIGLPTINGGMWHLFSNAIPPEAPYHDGMNLYQYVMARPTTLLDPSGTWCTRGATCYELEFAAVPGFTNPSAAGILGKAIGFVDAVSIVEFLRALRRPGELIFRRPPTGDNVVGFGELFAAYRDNHIMSFWHRYKCKACVCSRFLKYPRWVIGIKEKKWQKCSIRASEIDNPGEIRQHNTDDQAADLAKNCFDSATRKTQVICGTVMPCP